MSQKFSFADVAEISTACGIYEIHTHERLALKVGIGSNLKHRLARQKVSLDSGLRLMAGGDRENPSDVRSKSSVLAKHLFYDNSLTSDYDLRTQAGRQAFLLERCYFLVEYTSVIETARAAEKVRELSGKFRYVGRVLKR